MIVISCSSKKVINEQQIKLSLDNYGYPVNEFSYVMGVGDLNGDKKMDFIVRVFSEANKLKNDFETRSFAYQHNGTLLWELNHHIIPSEFSFEPYALVPLTIWDFNNDGKAEVVTLVKENEQYHLVMIDGIEGPDKILYQAELPEASKYVYGALAYLDGINPYVVIATGRESNVIAFDRTLKRYLQLDDPKYYSNHDCCWLLP